MCLMSTYSFAQLPAGSIAPNFTATDIDGNTHTLYDLLDEGKSVVLDVSATWCGPCWSYHNNGTLETLYEQYGPDGTDEMFMFMIEGDGTTGQADLEGSTTATQGNWIEGTPYPIIDDATIADAYSIAYFPTVYHVCPNRQLTEPTNSASTSQLHALHGQCIAVGGTDNAAIVGYDGEQDVVFCGELAFTPKISLQNVAENMLEAAYITLSMNGTVMSEINWTGSLSQFDIETVIFDEVTITDNTAFEINVVSVNSNVDSDPQGNSFATNFTKSELTQDNNVLNISITTDTYGCETKWEVINNETGELLATGGNPNAVAGAGQYGSGCPDGVGYAANTTFEEQVVLPDNGCYNFNIIDDYGDGICCQYGNGSYTVSDANSQVLFTGAEFTVLDGGAFNVEGFVDVQDVQGLNSLDLYPNPAVDYMMIDFNLADASNLQINVHNTLGQVVTSIATTEYATGTNQVKINTADYSNGTYFVTINGKNGAHTSKFTVNK